MQDEGTGTLSCFVAKFLAGNVIYWFDKVDGLRV